MYADVRAVFVEGTIKQNYYEELDDDATLAFVCLYSDNSEHSLNKRKVCVVRWPIRVTIYLIDIYTKFDSPYS